MKEIKKKVVTMCKIMEDLCVESREEGLRVGRAEGLSAGREEGISIGRITVLNKLVREGSLTKEKAASNAGMSVDEFERKIKELGL